MTTELDLAPHSLSSLYSHKHLSPRELVYELKRKSQEYRDRNIWIQELDDEALEPFLTFLDGQSVEDLPLYGIPFAIKDNIDLAGISTTAACPAFSYVPEENAATVEKLLTLGAIPLGKTNMDQFATGLNGTRSPYGICRNSYNPRFISGGSSSGSAVAVALDLVSFALGTDTAGSGRVPAAMNNIVGLKPTKGLLSTRGVVPACQSLDVLNVFSKTVDGCEGIFSLLEGYDEQDPYSRPWQQRLPLRVEQQQPRIGIPKKHELNFFGDSSCETHFFSIIETIRQQGIKIEEIEFKPFVDAAQLLYDGPWLAERQLACQNAMAHYPLEIDPNVLKVLTSRQDDAKQTFQAFYTLAKLKRLADKQLAKVDYLLTPTCGIQYTIDEVLNDPITTNNNLGYYTNYMNLLDYSAIAIPAGFSNKEVPFGVTLVAEAFKDVQLMAWAKQLVNYVSN